MRAGRERSPVGSVRRSSGVRPFQRRALPSIGIDFGGTKIALGIVDRHGRVLDSTRLPTQAERPATAVVDEVVASVRDRWGEQLGGAKTVGVGVAGQVGRDGSVLFGPHLDWHDVPLRSLLGRSLRRPVAVINDAQAATFGEWRFGAGRGAENLLGLFVGTGVGGGLVVDGRLYPGATGCAGEVGHLTVKRSGRRCHCGNTGCLDAYVGGWAIAERAKTAVRRAPGRGPLLVTLAGAPGGLTAESVVRASRRGDPLAKEVVRETLSYLADALASMVNSLNPETVVLGGGVVEGLRPLLPSLGREVRARSLPAAASGLRIVPASLGSVSALVGAAAFAREAPRR
ncbi:MAG TPA: ROK family protein [Thermoplasmata archaeon]|nr:ROK family protein [Thermoplasmata archaeon]